MDLEPFVLSLSLLGFIFGLYSIILLAYAPGPNGISLLISIVVVATIATAVRLWRRRGL